ncbi:hypothetical protein GCM10022212_23580 [Actimicrobium antarcticum]|uniref:Uncharacterized protein n=1 Tax=Actimicrobium antarcticum TaxID=1051899 RepID=A0ABP7TEK0_9BURK
MFQLNKAAHIAQQPICLQFAQLYLRAQPANKTATPRHACWELVDYAPDLEKIQHIGTARQGITLA